MINKPQVIDITPTAWQQIAHLNKEHEPNVLMLGINNKGCSGHSYTFDMIATDQIHKWDEVITNGVTRVVVNHKHVMHLMGSTLDYQSDLFGSKFVWHNPTVKNTCGCGKSVGF
jgi:iron-sulfur cluster assembly accessory protein